jgi:hypothetical protein
VVEVGHGAAHQLQRMGVVVGEVIRDAGKPRVHVRPAKLFRRHHLTGRRFHQRRAGEKDGALLLDDDRLVRHGRHIGPACRARAHDGSNLRNALGRHVGLVEEDAAKVIAVREHLVLVGQVGPAAVHQVDARQPVCLGNLLGAQVLLHRHRIVGAALHRGIIGDDHDLAALDPPDACNDAGAGRIAIVQPVRRGRADFKKRRAGVEQPRHPFTRQDLATRHMPLARRLSAAIKGCLHSLIDHRQRIKHRLAVGVELFTPRRRDWFENGHQAVS